MADDRLPRLRSASIAPTRFDRVVPRTIAISLRLVQKASSRLTLVLCPAMMTERLTTSDFIIAPLKLSRLSVFVSPAKISASNQRWLAQPLGHRSKLDGCGQFKPPTHCPQNA